MQRTEFDVVDAPEYFTLHWCLDVRNYLRDLAAADIPEVRLFGSSDQQHWIHEAVRPSNLWRGEDCPGLEGAFRLGNITGDSLADLMLGFVAGSRALFCFRGDTPDFLSLAEAVKDDEAVSVFAMCILPQICLYPD